MRRIFTDALGARVSSLLLIALVAGCVGQGAPDEREATRCVGDACEVSDDDQDGVEDSKDRCPNALEDRDAFKDEDGCPDPDNDDDNILDVDDMCPDDPEDIDDFQDEDGCPDLDNDQDAIPDLHDQCLDEPEDYDGDKDEDGCPDDNWAHPEPEYQILEKIFFDKRTATLPSDGLVMLDEIAKVLILNPQVPPMIIRGHAFEMAKEETNINLSRARAQAVYDYIVKEGVEPSRLSIDAAGSSRPLCDVKNIEESSAESEDECRAYNRRVDFEIQNDL